MKIIVRFPIHRTVCPIKSRKMDCIGFDGILCYTSIDIDDNNYNKWQISVSMGKMSSFWVRHITNANFPKRLLLSYRSVLLHNFSAYLNTFIIFLISFVYLMILFCFCFFFFFSCLLHFFIFFKSFKIKCDIDDEFSDKFCDEKTKRKQTRFSAIVFCPHKHRPTNQQLDQMPCLKFQKVHQNGPYDRAF